jgi:hypothetical protein
MLASQGGGARTRLELQPVKAYPHAIPEASHEARTRLESQPVKTPSPGDARVLKGTLQQRMGDQRQHGDRATGCRAGTQAGW